MMVCLRCGTVFCPEESLPGGSPQLYCSKQCKKKASTKRRTVIQAEADKEVHLRKNKKEYASIVEAREAAGEMFTRRGWVLYPYPCECGFFHLTRNIKSQRLLTKHQERATMYA